MYKCFQLFAYKHQSLTSLFKENRSMLNISLPYELRKKAFLTYWNLKAFRNSDRKEDLQKNVYNKAQKLMYEGSSLTTCQNRTSSYYQLKDVGLLFF